MKKIWMPILLSAFVIPGAGQLYNREKVKGWILIGLTVLVVVSAFIGVMAALLAIIPPGTVVTQEQTQALMNRLMVEKGTYFSSFSYLILAIWGYGILDAFLGARDRLLKSGDPSTELR